MTWGVVMVNSRLQWVWVRSGGSNLTNVVVVRSSLVRRHKSTSFGSLQQHDAAAVATPPRRGQGYLAHMLAHTARGKSEARSSNMQAHSRPRSSSVIITITRLLSAR